MWNEYEDVPESAVPRYKSLCDGGDADYRYRYCSNLLTVAIPPDTLRHRQTQNAPVWLSGRLSSHRHTRHDNTVLSASCLALRCEYAMHFDGAEQHLKLSLPLQGNPGPQLIVLAPTPVHNLSGISIGSSVFVGLTVMSNRQTHRHNTLRLQQEAASLHPVLAMRPNK